MTENSSRNVAPIEKIRFAGVLASIYANTVKDSPIPLYKVTYSRTYTKNGEFKTVTSFRWEDLPAIGHVSKQVWIRIEELKQQAWEATRKDGDSEPEETEDENE